MSRSEKTLGRGVHLVAIMDVINASSGVLVTFSEQNAAGEPNGTFKHEYSVMKDLLKMCDIAGVNMKEAFPENAKGCRLYIIIKEVCKDGNTYFNLHDVKKLTKKKPVVDEAELYEIQDKSLVERFTPFAEAESVALVQFEKEMIEAAPDPEKLATGRKIIAELESKITETVKSNEPDWDNF
jgi:hypothetical protein